MFFSQHHKKPHPHVALRRSACRDQAWRILNCATLSWPRWVEPPGGEWRCCRCLEFGIGFESQIIFFGINDTVTEILCSLNHRLWSEGITWTKMNQAFSPKARRTRRSPQHRVVECEHYRMWLGPSCGRCPSSEKTALLPVDKMVRAKGQHLQYVLSFSKNEKNRCFFFQHEQIGLFFSSWTKQALSQRRFPRRGSFRVAHGLGTSQRRFGEPQRGDLQRGADGVSQRQPMDGGPSQDLI